jgi:hypothetical protein
MKQLGSIVLLVILTAGLSSCEKIRGLFDVDFKTTLSGNLDIEIEEAATKSTNTYEFYKEAEVNPLYDVDIAEYEENIKNFAIDSVVAEVLSVNKGAVEFLTGTTFFINDNLDMVYWTLGQDWEITQGTMLSLANQGDVYDVVSRILNRKETFTVGVEGTCSDTGVRVVLKMGIKTTVTASPL